MKEINDNKTGISILILTIIVVGIGISFAYYSAIVHGTGNTNAETSANTATLGEVEFNGENTFDTTNIGRDIYPGFIGVQSFTVGPYKNGVGIYEIDLEANVPATFGNDVKLTLYKTSDVTNNNIDSEEGTLTIVNNRYTKQDTLIITGTLEKVYEGSLVQTDETMLEQVEFVIANNVFTTPDVTPDGYYTYYAVYEYLNNGNQNIQQGLDFDSKITVKYVDKIYNPAKDTLEDLQALNPDLVVTPSTSENPDFSIIAPRAANVDNDGKSEQTTGLFELPDNYGTSYYFRGSPTNNYVKFGGFYWRIIRINGDGSIRMIYAGDASVIDALPNKLEVLANGYNDTNGYSQIGTSKFNYFYNDNAYVGYKYGQTGSSSYENTHANTYGSDIYSNTQNWYSYNFLNTSYEQYLADAIFCNDRSIGSDEAIANAGTTFGKLGYGSNPTLYGANSRKIEEIRLGKGNKATLICPQKNDSFTVSDTRYGNGALSYPIGMITFDEVNLAGGIESKENNIYYLNTYNSYWTGSPSAHLHGYAYVEIVNIYGSTSNDVVNSTNGVRPVINLKPESINAGNGTDSNPFRIE